jgi:hypothetical protein
MPDTRDLLRVLDSLKSHGYMERGAVQFEYVA